MCFESKKKKIKKSDVQGTVLDLSWGEGGGSVR